MAPALQVFRGAAELASPSLPQLSPDLLYHRLVVSQQVPRHLSSTLWLDRSLEQKALSSRREMFLSKSLCVQPHITKDILTITFKKKPSEHNQNYRHEGNITLRISNRGWTS